MPIYKDIVKALDIILEEEVSHVKKGNRWFEWACKKEGVSKEIYFEIISLYYPKGFSKPREVNKNARLDAGFSCDELSFIAKKEQCS